MSKYTSYLENRWMPKTCIYNRKKAGRVETLSAGFPEQAAEIAINVNFTATD
jgi:hypothetical protein